MPDWQSNGDESQARLPGRGGGNVLRGVLKGVEWQALARPGHASLTIGRRTIHIMPDSTGSFVTHAMVGRWRDIGELAAAIIRFHPDYSPLARRKTV